MQALVLVPCIMFLCGDRHWRLLLQRGHAHPGRRPSPPPRGLAPTMHFRLGSHHTC